MHIVCFFDTTKTSLGNKHLVTSRPYVQVLKIGTQVQLKYK